MWLDNASDIDVLFYDPYAQIISDIARNKDYNPLTVGVFGLWGAGKSTLIKLIDNKLKEESDRILCVTINAWMFESYEDAKTAIMEALLQELEEKLPVEDAKKKIRNLLKRIDLFKLSTKTVSMLAPIAASVASGNPLPMMLNLTGSADEIGNTIKTAANSLQLLKDEFWKDDNTTTKDSTINYIRKFRKVFTDAIENSKIDNVVVMIDDLDRCRPERIIDILEAIKLFLSVEKTTFIIAVDENVIKYSIRERYPPMKGLEVELDKEYIEKIIQLPIHIPELSSKDIQNYLLLLVTQSCLSKENFQIFLKEVFSKKILISEDAITLRQINKMISDLNLTWINDNKEFNDISVVIDNIKDIVANALKGNPRQAKRFLNTFMTKRKLAKIYYGDELNMTILAKLLVLQKLDNDLFVQLNEWNKDFDLENVEFKKMRIAVEKGNNSDYESWATPAIQRWLKCQPVDLEKQRLDKYFYLTRENLKNRNLDISSFSGDVRKLLERIGQATSGLMKAIIEDAKSLSPEDLKDVFSVLNQKIEKNDISYFIIRDFYCEFASYREKIVDAIIKSGSKIKLADLAALRTMYHKDSTILGPKLDEMKTKDMLNEAMVNKIKEQRKE